MDDNQPGRGDLTVEQWAQRVAWAHRVWAVDIPNSDQRLVASCIHYARARAQGHKVPLVSAFTHPEMYPEFINTVFEEYAKRKLLGEAP